MTTLVIASGNTGKIAEIKALLQPFAIAVKPQRDYGVDDAEETGTTFVENAIIKARHAAEQTGLPALSDDSGLVVEALDGEPGVRSARYAGPGATSEDRIRKVLQNLGDDINRQASFHCVLVLCRYAADPTPVICHGVWQGEILTAPRGTQGFGYDPIFYVPTHDCSAAELSAEQKNSISHRARAFEQLQTYLNTIKDNLLC